jgi:hypothetical protein
MPDLPGVSSTDMDDWQLLIEVLSERVLWDRDFEAEDCHLDTDPQASAVVKRLLGIDDDCFVAVSREPEVRETQSLVVRLKELTGLAR